MAALTAWKFNSPSGADNALDKVVGELHDSDAELIQSNLTEEQDAKLRDAFANEA